MLLSWSLPLSSAMPPSSCNVNRRNKFTTQSFKSPASIAPGIITYCTSSLRRNPESRAAAAAAAANNDPSSAASSANAEDRDGEEEEGEEFRVLTAIRSKYNSIVILETRESRILLLDDSLNAHSILYKQQKWTNSYWDEFVSLPAIVPEGPIAIFGLGGGTVAHLLLWSWPSLQLDGWELDEILIDKAREYFGLSDLEKYTDAGGRLHIKVGDALSSSTNIPGGYAGIIVDLFSDGKVLPQLEKVETWVELSKKLMSSGRIMVNCGGSDNQVSVKVDMIYPSKMLSAEGDWLHHSTIKAINDAFGGKVCWKRMPDSSGANFLALSGPLPDLTSWSDSVPSKLASTVKLWNPCVHLQ